MILRPLRDTRDDAETVLAVKAASFGSPLADWPEVRTVRHRSRVRHFARTDPGGSWLALDDEGRAVGAALSSVREGTWGLSFLGVTPEAQGKGVGKALLRRSLEYGRGCLRGIICSSTHPAAARSYRAAGFTLHPAMELSGTVDQARLAAPDGPVIEGGPKHRDMLDSVDRARRGGAHGPDHEELMRHYRLIVADDLAGSGYCYLGDGWVESLSATSRRIATRLLTAALLSFDPGAPASVSDVTAEQEWAVDVGLAAGLTVANSGFVCLRGMRPPTPWIPSGGFL
ncbi:GNAT family N-acetyltransferase [Streptomyces sp. NPDC051940]|uniref:GNAT family N-acetyltransferase n=1 Tax=Streptomyces sp. NPDC051940 TaxID=3155675 RepID=UPI00341A8ABB